MGSRRGRVGGLARSSCGEPMIVLAIDTATDVVAVAVVSGTDVLAAAEVRSDRRHAEELTPMIDFVRRRADVSYRDLDAIAVDIGPGLFTGMRVGIAAAKAMAYMLDIPTIPVCSLDALAADVGADGNDRSGDDGDARDGDVVVPVLDARRHEVYWAMYRPADTTGNHRRVLDPLVGSRDDLVASIRDRGQHVTFIGDWARQRADDLVEELAAASLRCTVIRDHPGVPRINTVARLAATAALHEQWCDATALQAMYLRSPDVQISWETRPT